MADGSDNLSLVRLCDATLDRLPEAILRPRYDRSSLRAGIVHVGLGNFHRAHQAWYLHSLMQSGEALDWAIIGAGVRPADAAQRDRLLAQDCLTTLVELDPSGRSAEVIGPMIDFLPVEDDNASLIAKMADPDIRIVSLTVTEGGYFIDPATGAFDHEHEDIRYDVAHPEQPRTVFGAMVAALKLRRAGGLTPFTAMCCDNLQNNGVVLRQTVVGLARLSDPDLAAWIDDNGAFPNSMVDCIVPATGPAELELVQSFGISDAAPVTHENFRQWVIEDSFCAGRPAWEKVGATLTHDVHAYEVMKIRILNGGHQVLANSAELLGIETIAEAMAHPLISGFFEKVVTEEISPHVEAVPGMTPSAYLQLITRRFANVEILDTTRRVAFDGASRHPGFIQPSIRDGIASNTSVNGLALVSALWAIYCRGVREDGSQIEPNDPQWAMLNETAICALEDPAQWLEMRQFYGQLADEAVFKDRFVHWHRALQADGVAACLEAYIRG